MGLNMSLNKYFKRAEFQCKGKNCNPSGVGNCGFSTVDVELLEVLTTVREHFNAAVTINSSCRCATHNKAIGGADGSKHKLGIAADITVKGYAPVEVYDFLCRYAPLKYGMSKYETFVHIDVRSTKARW
jgi:uncharacterized protein YcbK (DUF882 family)